MKNYKGSYFTVSIPDIWDAEFDQEEGVDVLYNPKGHGEIQISSVLHEEELTPNDLMHIAGEDIQSGANLQELDQGAFQGFWFDYEVDDEYWCEWYLCCGHLMLFATYSCPVKDEGKEYHDIDLIIRTLSPAEFSHKGA